MYLAEICCCGTEIVWWVGDQYQIAMLCEVCKNAEWCVVGRVNGGVFCIEMFILEVCCVVPCVV